MAGVMELTQPNQTTMPNAFLVGKDSLQFPNHESLAVSGDSSEKLPSALEVSDYITFRGGLSDGLLPFTGVHGLNPVLLTEGGADSGDVGRTSHGIRVGEKMKKMEPGVRFVFRTKSVVDVLDDGYKWRKYGKKSIKSSPSPRNYYRCSVEGCGVKKRVERDWKDSRYVLTEYDGVHNHMQPVGVVFYPVPLDHAGSAAAPAEGVLPDGWRC